MNVFFRNFRHRRRNLSVKRFATRVLDSCAFFHSTYKFLFAQQTYEMIFHLRHPFRSFQNVRVAIITKLPSTSHIIRMLHFTTFEPGLPAPSAWKFFIRRYFRTSPFRPRTFAQSQLTFIVYTCSINHEQLIKCNIILPRDAINWHVLHGSYIVHLFILFAPTYVNVIISIMAIRGVNKPITIQIVRRNAAEGGKK